MKYNLDKELIPVAKFKIPANTKLLPMMNFFMKAFKCESDDKVLVKHYKVAGDQGAEIPVMVIEPRDVTGVLPGFVFFHGGGFILRASDGHYQIAKDYAEAMPCRVIYADYRLAPKFPFPIPAEDCFAVYQWTVRHAEKLKIDSEKIMVGGDSAGGNLAAAVCLMARDRKVSVPERAMLIYPVTDRRMITESMKEYTDTPVWDAKLSKMMWDAYLGEQNPQRIEYASPIEAGTLERFPKTYIEVAEFDSLCDEGVWFYNRLKEEGIDAVLYEVKGACHGFERARDSHLTRICFDRRIKWLRSFESKTDRNADRA